MSTYPCTPRYIGFGRVYASRDTSTQRLKYAMSARQIRCQADTPLQPLTAHRLCAVEHTWFGSIAIASTIGFKRNALRFCVSQVFMRASRFCKRCSVIRRQRRRWQVQALLACDLLCAGLPISGVTYITKD